MNTTIEVTPFINGNGELAYEIAIDDELDTRLLEVTVEELDKLADIFFDIDHDEERARLE